MLYDPELEVKYNMDPTSLVLFAIELLDIRKDRDEAFECFVYVPGQGSTTDSLTSFVQAGMAPSAPSHCDHEAGDKLLTSPDCFEQFERG